MRYLIAAILFLFPVLLPIAVALVWVIGGAIWDIAEDFEKGWK